MFFAVNGARFGFAMTVLQTSVITATWLVTVVIGLGMMAL